MGIRIDYKSFNFNKIELTESGYNSHKRLLESGVNTLGGLVPKPSFKEVEAIRIKSFKYVVIAIVVSGILSMAFTEEDSIYGMFIAVWYLCFFGVVVFGGGLLLSFLSFTSYLAKREAFLIKMKSNISNSSSYEDYLSKR